MHYSCVFYFQISQPGKKKMKPKRKVKDDDACARLTSAANCAALRPATAPALHIEWQETEYSDYSEDEDEEDED